MTKDQVIEALKTVKDPEIHLDIWTMGLIYNIEILCEEDVMILMTYTTPFCPWGPQMNAEVEEALKKIGFKKVDIEITFDPPYTMPEGLRATLGI